jgi:hypothetical protein
LMEKFGTCMVGLIYGNVVFDFPGLSLWISYMHALSSSLKTTKWDFLGKMCSMKLAIFDRHPFWRQLRGQLAENFNQTINHILIILRVSHRRGLKRHENNLLRPF